jgi:hypothetical protein
MDYVAASRHMNPYTYPKKQRARVFAFVAKNIPSILR